jgi:hypothetical protein
MVCREWRSPSLPSSFGLNLNVGIDLLNMEGLGRGHRSNPSLQNRFNHLNPTCQWGPETWMNCLIPIPPATSSPSVLPCAAPFDTISDGFQYPRTPEREECQQHLQKLIQMTLRTGYSLAGRLRPHEDICTSSADTNFARTVISASYAWAVVWSGPPVKSKYHNISGHRMVLAGTGRIALQTDGLLELNLEIMHTCT